MTAQSSLLSNKRYPRKDASTSTHTSKKRGQKPQPPRIKPRGLNFEGLNGELTKRLFDITFSLLVLILFSLSI